jgi:hypothetical protein
MTAKEELLREIESATDGLLIEVLSFLQGLKTRWAESKNFEITDDVVLETAEPTPTDLASPESNVPTFEDFFGILKDSPNFNADPVMLQQSLCREWDSDYAVNAKCFAVRLDISLRR